MNRSAPLEKKALVTAGANGIGQVIALALGKAGYQVHVCDIDTDALARTAERTPEVHGHRGDVSQADDVERVFAAMDEHPGTFSLLVNNAGISGPTAPLQDISPEDWTNTLSVNLDGAFLCARAATPRLLKAGGGSILNIASNAALFGFPNRLPYAVSKWGLIGLTKTLAMELGPHGIRVNALCPGSVNGPRIEGVIHRDATERGVDIEAVHREYTRQSSLRCFVDAEDVAAMAVFLASPSGERISGQAIAIDGHTEGLFQFDHDSPLS